MKKRVRLHVLRVHPPFLFLPLICTPHTSSLFFFFSFSFFAAGDRKTWKPGAWIGAKERPQKHPTGKAWHSDLEKGGGDWLGHDPDPWGISDPPWIRRTLQHPRPRAAGPGWGDRTRFLQQQKWKKRKKGGSLRPEGWNRMLWNLRAAWYGPRGRPWFH